MTEMKANFEQEKNKIFEEIRSECPWKYRKYKNINLVCKCEASNRDCSQETCAPFFFAFCVLDKFL